MTGRVLEVPDPGVRSPVVVPSSDFLVTGLPGVRAAVVLRVRRRRRLLGLVVGRRR